MRIGDLTAAEQRALIIADNQTALRAGWDLDTLRLELTELEDMDFDLGPIGFSDEELASILASNAGESIDHGIRYASIDFSFSTERLAGAHSGRAFHARGADGDPEQPGPVRNGFLTGSGASHPNSGLTTIVGAITRNGTSTVNYGTASDICIAT